MLRATYLLATLIQSTHLGIVLLVTWALSTRVVFRVASIHVRVHSDLPIGRIVHLLDR